MSRFIGTIIDASYFKSFILPDKTGHYHLYKMCPYCDDRIDLGFGEDVYLSSFTETLPHQCEFWVDEARRKVGAIEKYYLPDNGFIFKKPNPTSEH